MAHSVNLAADFKPYVDEMFATESKIKLLTNSDFSWTGAHTIFVYKINTAPMQDYNRAGDFEGYSRYGKIQGLNATTQEMTLGKDRSFTFETDLLDTDETKGQLDAASALARQVREVVIPEIDKYVYGVMCEKAGHKPEAIELTPDNIYTEIIKGSAALDNAEVPDTKRILLVTPNTFLMMKQCPDITMTDELDADLKLLGVVTNLDGCAVIKVPASRLPENFGFLIAHPMATVAPVKLEDYVTHNRPPGINGSLVEGRLCYDAFVLDNKAKAIYYQAVTA